MGLQFCGAAAFGIVVGWTTYFILRRAQPKTLSDITTFIGGIGGAAVTTLFDPKGEMFAGYAFGLLIGFIAYYFVFLWLVGKHAIRESLITESPQGPEPDMLTPMSSLDSKEKSINKPEVNWGADRKPQNTK